MKSPLVAAGPPRRCQKMEMRKAVQSKRIETWKEAVLVVVAAQTLKSPGQSAVGLKRDLQLAFGFAPLQWSTLGLALRLGVCARFRMSYLSVPLGQLPQDRF